MLKEASLWLRDDHDHTLKLNLHDNVPKDCTSSFGEAFAFHVFQLEIEPNPVDVRDQFSSEGEHFDELWLFGKECWIRICMHAVSLNFGID